MVSLKRDDNRIATLGATSNIDGVSVVNVVVDPTSNRLKVSIGDMGMSFTSLNAKRDDNRQPVMMGVSSADLTTVIPIYAESNGFLKIKQT